MATWQGGIDEGSFASGAGDPLVRPVEACPAASPAPTAECIAVYGPGSTCSLPGPVCDVGFFDSSRPDQIGLELAAVAQPAPIRYGATKGPFQAAVADPGGAIYGGYLTLEAQAGSSGTYSIDVLQDASTFFTFGDQTAGVIGTFSSAIVDIPLGQCCLTGEVCVDGITEAECRNQNGFIIFNAGNDCNDPCAQCTVPGDNTDCAEDAAGACTVNTCTPGLQCVYTPIGGWDPNTQCCDPAGAIVADRDDGDACTDDTCDVDDAESLGSPQHDVSGAGTVCDDGNACTFDDICDGVSSEADVVAPVRTPTASCAGTATTAWSRPVPRWSASTASASARCRRL